MDGSNEIRMPLEIPRVVAAEVLAGNNANHRREMEKQDRMKKVSFLLFNPVR